MGWATKYVYIYALCVLFKVEVVRSHWVAPYPKHPNRSTVSNRHLSWTWLDAKKSTVKPPIVWSIIWATVNIWYIAPSHQFLKSVLSFFRLWYIYISICYRFLKSVLSFSKPQLNFQQIKMSRILLSINLNFGCSSYHRITKCYSYCYCFCALTFNMALGLFALS